MSYRKHTRLLGRLLPFVLAAGMGMAVQAALGEAAVPGPGASTRPSESMAAAASEQPQNWLALGERLASAAGARSESQTESQPTKPDAGQDPSKANEPTAEDLAKAAQNPMASMISVPLQSNFNFYDIDTTKYSRHTMSYVLNVQPVIPFTLNDDWNLITRTIVPVINQPETSPDVGSHGGLGDIQLSLFLGPAKPSKLIWGVGPVLQFPTATDQWLGTEKWSAGPSAVALTMQGPWVMGVLAQNLWSYAGESDRNYVNQTLIQPFVNYNLPQGWYLTTSPAITADWHADSDERWTVPVGGGIGNLFKIGKLPVTAQIGAYYNTVHPTYGPEWSARFQIQFLFPK